MKMYRNIAFALVCVVLGASIAIQFKSVNNNQKMDVINNKGLNELRDELLREKKSTEDLTTRNDELINENLKYQKATGNITDETKALQDELNRVRIIAGLVDVKGKGLIVTVDKGTEQFVNDSDILLVLNELRASDAQAISVNGERIIAMSEVRVAGRYIMINRKQMLPPFVIKAIAAPNKLENALRMMDGAIETLEAYNLSVKVEQSDNIIIPGVKDDGSVIKTDLLSPVEQK